MDLPTALTSDFSLLKRRDNADPRSTTSWQVFYRDRLVYEINQKELDDIYGGYSAAHGGPPPIDCGNIAIGIAFFAFRMGWQNDLVLAFGIERGESGVRGVKILRYYAHDEPIALSTFLSTSYNDLLVVHGLNRARFCWNPKGDDHWWHNGDHRADAFSCIGNSWPWEYPTTSEQEVLFD